MKQHAEPRPTVWPAGLALGLTLLAISPTFWYLSAWFFACAGMLLTVSALRGWILELRADLTGDSDE